MNDRELLELAAKVAGVSGKWDDTYRCLVLGRDSYGIATSVWNPLDNDAHALRLAVALGMLVGVRPELNKSYCHAAEARVAEPHSNSDPPAATRRAIVRAAAALGDNK